MTDESVFAAALAIPSPADRVAFLDRACAGNPALRKEIDELLAAHAVSNALDRPPADLARTGAYETDPDARPVATAGDRIGPYKLLERIGEGGMGEVWVADQLEPLRRRVALKLIKPGMDSRAVLARFEAERQALAVMDHPNIARVLDAGTTPDGRPFFVMELVKGTPITEFADARRLTPRERLALFVPVCQAIQHAHQKGIIHRDIKPSNVLVALHDETPVPKVIDFGVAKAIGQQLSEKTVYTGFDALVGTPAYMAPEQATFNQLDVDTRADVYALGVLLYELLAGTPPVEPDRLRKAALDEVLRIVRDEEPPRPSQRLSSSHTKASIAATRQTEPAKLSRLLRGELDWIVMKALEKDRGRRYDTPTALARDVQRYLTGDAVEACPPTLGYRLRKLYWKNRAAVLVGGVISLVLLAAAGISLAFGVAAKQAEGDARRAEADAGRERDTANAEREKAETARLQGQEKLLQALMAEARASKLSRRVGQRFDTLKAVREAVALARELNKPAKTFDELRNLSIAALALPDIRPDDAWITERVDADLAWRFRGVDPTYRYAAIVQERGNVSIRRVGRTPDDTGEVGRLTSPGGGSVAWGPGGRHLGMYDNISRLRVWRTEGDRPVQVLEIGAECTGFGFAPGGRQVVAVVGTKLRVYDLDTGRLERTFSAPAKASGLLAHHPTRPEVAIRTPSQVVIQDMTTGEVRGQLPAPGATSFPHWHEEVAWHPHGELLAVVGGDYMELWDVARRRVNHRLEHAGGGLYATFNEAGDLMASAGWNGRVKLWNPHTGREVLATTGGGFDRLAPGERLSLVRRSASPGEAATRLAVVEPAREYRTLVVGSGAVRTGQHGICSVHPDGRLLAVGTAAGVSLMDLVTGSERAFLPGQCSWVLFEPVGSLLVKSHAGLFRLPVGTDPRDPQKVVFGSRESVPVSAQGEMIVRSADGAVLAVSNGDGAKVWHRDRPREAVHLTPHADCRYLAISPDGKWVATGSWHGRGIKVWEVATGREVKTFLPHTGITNPNFSADGRWLYNRGGESWRTADWSEGPAHHGGAFAYGWPVFPRDSRLAAWSMKGFVTLTNPETGRDLARLEDPHQDGLGAMTFSPDGTQLIGATGDSNCVRVWDLRKIRKGLVELGLDWDAPPYPPEPVATRPTTPLQVEVIGTELLAPKK